MKTYKIAKGWAIFIYIIAPGLIGLFTWLMIQPYLPGYVSEKSDETNIFLFVSPPMIILMVLGILDAIKSKIIIGHDTISYRSTFVNRDLKIDEVKGFRIVDKYYFVEPKFKDKKRIKISTYIGKSDEILDWLIAHFDDLDAMDQQIEEQEIEADLAINISEENHIAQLNKARTVAKLMNWAGGISAIWLYFYPTPYSIALIANLIVPLFCIVSLVYFKGLIRFTSKSKIYPSVITGFLFPSLALGLRALIDFEIYNYSEIFLPLAIGLGTLGILSSTFIQEFRFAWRTVANTLGFYFLLLVYCYGAILSVNCYFDTAITTIYTATIKDKRISDGKTTTYYLELTPWGNRKEQAEVSVSKSLYNKSNTNDNVYICLNNGLLKIKWFYVFK